MCPSNSNRFSTSVIESSLPADPALEETLKQLGFVIPGWGSEMTILRDRGTHTIIRTDSVATLSPTESMSYWSTPALAGRWEVSRS